MAVVRSDLTTKETVDYLVQDLDDESGIVQFLNDGLSASRSSATGNALLNEVVSDISRIVALPKCKYNPKRIGSGSKRALAGSGGSVIITPVDAATVLGRAHELSPDQVETLARERSTNYQTGSWKAIPSLAELLVKGVREDRYAATLRGFVAMHKSTSLILPRLYGVILAEGDSLAINSWAEATDSEIPAILAGVERAAGDLAAQLYPGHQGDCPHDEPIKALDEALHELTSGRAYPDWSPLFTEDGDIGKEQNLKATIHCATHIAVSLGLYQTDFWDERVMPVLQKDNRLPPGTINFIERAFFEKDRLAKQNAAALNESIESESKSEKLSSFVI